jgi:translocation and assembly module TamA
VEFRRLNRKGHRAEIDLTLSGIERSFASRYMIPGAYPRTDVLTFSLGYAQFRPGSSKSNTALAGVERAVSRGRWRETLGLLFQREQFVVGLDKGTSYLTMPSAHYERVKADDRLFTHNGWKLAFDGKGAVKNAGSDTSMFRPYALGKYIKTIFDRTRFIGRVELGYIATNDFHKLPPRIRFWAGGDQSVRGYRFQRLGELDPEGSVIGGEALRVVSLEVDRMVSGKFGGLGVAGFFDMGNATHSFSEKLKKGTGVGVRWRSPIGMVRADVAWALDLPKTPIRLHLNIGPDL